MTPVLVIPMEWKIIRKRDWHDLCNWMDYFHSCKSWGLAHFTIVQWHVKSSIFSSAIKMSEKTMKHLLNLNWGYRFGLWTYHLKIVNNNLEVTRTPSLFREIFSVMMTLSISFGHFFTVIIFVLYEMLKPERNILETNIIISMALLFSCFIMGHLYTLDNIQFYPAFLRNASLLRRKYGKLT